MADTHYLRACELSEQIAEMLVERVPDWERIYQLSEELHDLADGKR